jgi:hypothetical protein
MLVSYEQMKKDLHSIISQVAQFLNIDTIKNKELFDNVEKYGSFDYVGRCFTLIMTTLIEQYEVRLSDLNSAQSQHMNDRPSYVNNEQSQRLDMITTEKTRDMPSGVTAFGQ